MASFKRSLSTKILEGSKFLMLTQKQQILYIQLCVHSDDEGVAEGVYAMLLSRTSKKDYEALADSGLIIKLNDNYITYIIDWQEHSMQRQDRIAQSAYHDLIVANPYIASKNKTEECPEEETTEDTAQTSCQQADADVSESCQTVDSDMTDTCQQDDSTLASTPCQHDNEVAEDCQLHINNKKNIYLPFKEKIYKKESFPSLGDIRLSLSESFIDFPEELVQDFADFLSQVKCAEKIRLDAYAKKAFELSNGDAAAARQIIERAIRCGYKDLYPLSKPRGEPKDAFARDKTGQFDDDDSILEI